MGSKFAKSTVSCVAPKERVVDRDNISPFLGGEGRSRASGSSSLKAPPVGTLR